MKMFLDSTKTAVLFALLAFATIVSGQATFQRFAIDDFRSGTNTLQIVIPQSPSFPIELVSIYTDPGNPQGLLGGERDLKLAAQSGPSGRVLTSDVAAGEWTVSTPNGASGFANMQYDGKDNSFDLSNNGLGGLDFTDGGLAEAFTAIIETDVDTEYTFTVTSPNGGQCERVVTIPGTQSASNYFIPFDDFQGNCNFGNVGAVEIFIEQFANVDSLITLFAVVGDPDPVTPSNTPTPTPPPSGSAPPSASRSPSPPSECVCDCPAFRCGIVYKQRDDDDDSVDDDTHDDDDLVYRPVYYGPVDDDFDDLTGDDDEDEFISFKGGLTETGIHDDDDLVFDTANDASSVVVSAALVLVAAVLAL